MSKMPAYERNGQPCSREDFYAVACDPGRSVVVEACAGAGKTWMLVSRILRALLDGAQPQDILAITFTRKAAAEMRQRLHEWLQDFARPRAHEDAHAHRLRLIEALQQRGLGSLGELQLTEKASRLQALYPCLLEQARSVQIRTFHGWFATLLDVAPLRFLQDFGLQAHPELLQDDSQAVQQVWRPFLRKVAENEALRADYQALVAQRGRTRVHQALEDALGKRVEFMLADAAGAVAHAVECFQQAYPQWAQLESPFEVLQGDVARKRWLARAQALGQEKNKTPRTAADKVTEAFESDELQARLQILRDAFFVKKENRLSKNLQAFAAAQDAANELQDLLQAVAQHEAWLYHQRMSRLARVLMACYARLKQEHGWVDMPDVERAALSLLSDHELSAWVQERLDAQVRHLLVDEFQDTNPLQWQALHAWLSGYAGTGGGQAAPTVFIVGDPKQSIYRFRRADPAIFAHARQFVIQALDGEFLSCDHTWRNAPEVLQVVNTVMGQAAIQTEDLVYRAHTSESEISGEVLALPLIPRLPKLQGEQDALAWRDSLREPQVIEEEGLRLQECQQVAAWIAARLHSGLPPADLMVLARKRASLEVLRDVLQRQDIACELVDKQKLNDDAAVLDVLALVDVLLSPDNNLALARALKSPIFGLQDTDLVQLALAARANEAKPVRASWLDMLAEAHLPHVDARQLHARLQQYQQWLLHLPPHDALQAIYSDADVLARFAAASPPSARTHVLASLRALLAASLSMNSGRFLTAYAWLRIMRKQAWPAPQHKRDQAVQLLTVHGAKGLEAEEVVLLDAASDVARTRSEPTVLISWPGHARAPQLLAFVAKINEPPPSLSDLADAEAQAQGREEINALYVAMTRARRCLVVSGLTPHYKPRDSWWQRLDGLADAVPAPLVLAQPEFVSASSARHTDIEFRQLPDLSVALAPVEAPLPPVDEISDDLPLRMGQAMHELLEHTLDGDSAWHPQREQKIQHRQGLNAAQMRQVVQMARRILKGEAAWAWQADELEQAFNELEIMKDGQCLRMDRLVLRRATSQTPQSWWILDYKSAWQPQQESDNLHQLRSYAQALQKQYPDALIRTAFLSSQGRLIEVD